VGWVTVSVAVPVIVPEAAVIVVLPWPLLVASPAELTVATEVSEELQVAEAVRFWVLLSV
jgi:hypothetical protein